LNLDNYDDFEGEEYEFDEDDFVFSVLGLFLSSSLNFSQALPSVLAPY